MGLREKHPQQRIAFGIPVVQKNLATMVPIPKVSALVAMEVHPTPKVSARLAKGPHR
jgi:hypothetical protein